MHKIFLQGHQIGTIAFQKGDGPASGSMVTTSRPEDIAPVAENDLAAGRGLSVTFHYDDRPVLDAGVVLVAIMNAMIGATKEVKSTPVVGDLFFPILPLTMIP